LIRKSFFSVLTAVHTDPIFRRRDVQGRSLTRGRLLFPKVTLQGLIALDPMILEGPMPVNPLDCPYSFLPRHLLMGPLAAPLTCLRPFFPIAVCLRPQKNPRRDNFPRRSPCFSLNRYFLPPFSSYTHPRVEVMNSPSPPPCPIGTSPLNPLPASIWSGGGRRNGYCSPDLLTPIQALFCIKDGAPAILCEDVSL